MAAGYVYILSNPGYPGHLKIGMTTRTPEARARELSRETGVLHDFAVAYSEHVPDCEEAERLVHAQLARLRFKRRKEFFELELRYAIPVVAQVACEVRRRYSPAPVPVPVPPPTPPRAAPPPLPARSSEPTPAPPDEEPLSYRAYLYTLAAFQLIAVVVIVVANLDRDSQRAVFALLGIVGVLAVVATCVAAVKECSWVEGFAYTVLGLGAIALVVCVVALAMGASGGGRQRRGVGIPRRRIGLWHRRRRW